MMPRTRAEVENDPAFQKLSPQARQRVLERIGQSPAPTAGATATATAQAPTGEGHGVMSHVPGGRMAGKLFDAFIETEKGVGKGAARTAIGLGQLVNKIPFPFQGEEGDRRQADDARLLEGAAKEFGTPEGPLQDLGFLTEQLGEAAITMLTTRGAGGMGTGGRIAATAQRLAQNAPGFIKNAAAPLTRATVGAVKGGTEGAAIRAAQTGGDPVQTAAAGTLGAAVPAVAEGVLRPLSRVIAPHVISKVIGATPKSFPKEGKRVLEGARGVAMDLLRHGPVNSREEFLSLAARRLEGVTRQIERARSRGMVPGQGFVPKALRDAEEHTKLLVDGLTQAIQKSKARGLPDISKFGIRALPTTLLGGFAAGVPGAVVGGAGYLGAKVMETSPIATRLARFGFEMHKSRPSASWRAPMAARAMTKAEAKPAADVVSKSQQQFHSEEFEALTEWSAKVNKTPAGAASNLATRQAQVRSVLEEEGLSEIETKAVEQLYFGNGDLSLDEAIGAVVRRR